jgi:ATP-dependent Clp protease ATP-binding subunit ClpA
MSCLREDFKPEFLNRLDEVIIFHPISRSMLKLIVDLQVKHLQKRLEEKDIKLTITAAAKEYLAKKGYDPAYGARPLKRVIQNEIMDELALKIIEGSTKEGGRVRVDVENDKIAFKK